jgi:signal transduction histidine kinase
VLKVLARAPDTASAASQMLHAVGTTLNWPYMRLWGVDTVTDRLRPIATFTAPDQPPLPIPDSVAPGVGMAGQCWQQGEPIWVPDIQAADSPVLPEIAAGNPYRAAGAVPVRSGDTVTGVMTFFSYRRQEPDPGLSVLLSGIAGHIGAYLAHRRADELARQLAATTQEYIALVGHELRTPLTSIGTCAELISDEPDTTRIGDVRPMLDTISRNNTQLRNLIDQLLDLAALDSGYAPLTITTVNLSDVAAEAIGRVRSTCEHRRVTINAQCRPSYPSPVTAAASARSWSSCSPTP